MRLSGRSFVLLFALMGIVLVYATGQIAPAESAYQAQLRIWLAARATGIAALVLLTGQVFLGLVMSHPANSSIWRLSKRIFPWHENLVVFTVALLAIHVVAIVLDPYAGVGIAGTLVPGLSTFRTVPVALGTLGLYALAVTTISARYTKLLPPGVWLKLHRLSLVVLVLAWMHGLLAGADSAPLRPVYVGSAGIIIAAAMHRYWATRRARVAPQRPAMAQGAVPVTER
jgi:predicted ferric reductase